MAPWRASTLGEEREARLRWPRQVPQAALQAAAAAAGFPPARAKGLSSHTPLPAQNRYLRVDAEKQRDLFYMLAEAESSGNSTDEPPLLLWTQG